MRVKLLLLLIVCLMCSGCVAHQTGYKSYVAPDMPMFDMESSSADIAKALIVAYPPGRTMLDLGVGNDAVFGQALENALRGQGFKLGNDAVALKLTYRLDRLFDEAACYLTVNLSDGWIYSRTYMVNGNAAEPVAALKGRK